MIFQERKITMMDDSSEEEFIPEYVPIRIRTPEQLEELNQWLVDELGVDPNLL